MSKWKPKYGGLYYAINTYIPNIQKCHWYDLRGDNDKWKIGNCFKTFKQAQAADKRVRKVLKTYTENLV